MNDTVLWLAWATLVAVGLMIPVAWAIRNEVRQRREQRQIERRLRTYVARRDYPLAEDMGA